MKKVRGNTVFYFLSLAVFFVSSTSFSQDASRNSWLSSEVVELEKIRDGAVSDIAKYESKIDACEADVSQFEAMVKRNVKNGKFEAEQVARQALANAQEAQKKNEAGKSTAEARKARAEEAIARMRNRLTNASPVDAEIQAVVSNYSGYGQYFSKRLDKVIAFDDPRAGYLEAGDIIRTSPGSKAQIHFLDGRGTMDIGGDSKLEIEQSDNDLQVIGLLKGEIHEKDKKVEDLANGELRGLKSKFKKKFEVRTGGACCAVRGTRLLITVDELKGKEFVVFEGTVEVLSEHNPKITLLNAGYRIKMAVDGTLSEPEKIDTAEIERWWEK